MTIGEIVDYVYEYNEIHEVSTDDKKPKKVKGGSVRRATQSDWDALWG